LPRLTSNTAPPPGYYADNLLSVAQLACEHSADLLGDTHGLLVALPGLSEDAQRLLARLIMRTTPVIRSDSLGYAEVSAIDSALAELTSAGWIDLNAAVSAQALLARVKVAELKAIFTDQVRSGDRKTTLVERILSSYTDAAVRARCLAHSLGWVTLRAKSDLRLMQLVYFGDLYRDLTEFVMRDLGIAEFEPYPLGESARAFETAAEMRQYLMFSQLQNLPLQRRHSALQWLFAQIQQQVNGTTDPPTNASIVRRRDKLLNGWGRDFERAKQPEYAHACYQRATTHPARERRVRLLAAEKTTAGDRAVQSLLEQISAQPWSFEEALFAEKFASRLAGKAARVPDKWPESVWFTAKPALPNVEWFTARTLTLNGGRAWHTENSLLTSLLGLAFWDIIFAPVQGMFTHPFQNGPRDLFWPDFRSRRGDLIDNRLSECRDKAVLWGWIERHAAEKAGRACRLVHWGAVGHNNNEILRTAKASFRADTLTRVFDYMLTNLQQVRSGMPDLFVCYGAGCYELVEVKGPGDQLQPNQRIWLGKLSELGVPCRVIKYKSTGRTRKAIDAQNPASQSARAG